MNKAIPSLWDFATERYALPGVAERCLRLQDEHDFDVNLLLFCCWYGTYYGEIDNSALKRLSEYSRQWQALAVQPIRQTRRWLKDYSAESSHNEQQREGLTALREQVKALELTLEQQQLEVLQEKVADDVIQKSGVGSQQLALNLRRLHQLMGDTHPAIEGLLGELQQRIEA